MLVLGYWWGKDLVGVYFVFVHRMPSIVMRLWYYGIAAKYWVKEARVGGKWHGGGGGEWHGGNKQVWCAGVVCRCGVQVWCVGVVVCVLVYKCWCADGVCG